MFAQSIVQASGMTIPAILAQVPSPSRNELMSFILAAVAVAIIAAILIALFKNLFPRREPPIEVDLAKLASKEDLRGVEKRLDDKIAANDMAHVDIRDQMRDEVRREIAVTANAFKELREGTDTAMAGIRGEMAASCAEMRIELKSAIQADEARSSNIHRRLDPLIQKLSYIAGKLNVGDSNPGG